MGFWQPGSTVRVVRTLTDATGLLANADSLPTGAVYRNGTLDNAVTVTVANLATGRYSLTFTVPSGYALGDDVALLLLATMGGIATGATVWEERLTATPPTAVAIREEMDENSTQLASIAANAATAAAGTAPTVDEIMSGFAGLAVETNGSTKTLKNGAGSVIDTYTG